MVQSGQPTSSTARDPPRGRFFIRLDRAQEGSEPATLWLRSVVPLRLGRRDQAMTFETRGEALRTATTANLVGWVLDDASREAT